MSNSEWLIYLRTGLTWSLVKLEWFNIIGLPCYGIFEGLWTPTGERNTCTLDCGAKCHVRVAPLNVPVFLTRGFCALFDQDTVKKYAQLLSWFKESIGTSTFIKQSPKKPGKLKITFQQPAYVKVQKAHPNVSKPISSTRVGRLGHGVVGFAGMGEDLFLQDKVLTSERKWG